MLADLTRQSAELRSRRVRASENIVLLQGPMPPGDPFIVGNRPNPSNPSWRNRAGIAAAGRRTAHGSADAPDRSLPLATVAQQPAMKRDLASLSEERTLVRERQTGATRSGLGPGRDHAGRLQREDARGPHRDVRPSGRSEPRPCRLGTGNRATPGVSGPRLPSRHRRPHDQRGHGERLGRLALGRLSVRSRHRRGDFHRGAESVTADDVALSGVKFTDWFAQFHLAERRVLARKQEAGTLQARQLDELQHENRDFARRIAEREGVVRDAAKILAQDGKRLTALERRPVGLNYGGVWSPERDYPANSLVTDKGALHLATEMTIKGERPGSGGPWRTISKSDEVMIKKAVRDELRSKSPAQHDPHDPYATSYVHCRGALPGAASQRFGLLPQASPQEGPCRPGLACAGPCSSADAWRCWQWTLAARCSGRKS